MRRNTTPHASPASMHTFMVKDSAVMVHKFEQNRRFFGGMVHFCTRRRPRYHFTTFTFSAD
jgi:hypothetical protein